MHDGRELIAQVAHAVRSQRTAVGISQEDLARRAGLHRTYLSAVEAGKRNVTIKTLTRIAEALGASLPTLLDGREATMPDGSKHQLGPSVQQLRKERGLSQLELARASKLHRSYICGVEIGRRNPRLLNVAQLAAALGVPVAALFDRHFREREASYSEEP